MFEVCAGSSHSNSQVFAHSNRKLDPLCGWTIGINTRTLQTFAFKHEYINLLQNFILVFVRNISIGTPHQYSSSHKISKPNLTLGSVDISTILNALESTLYCVLWSFSDISCMYTDNKFFQTVKFIFALTQNYLSPVRHQVQRMSKTR